jgi:TonB family protein
MCPLFQVKRNLTPFPVLAAVAIGTAMAAEDPVHQSEEASWGRLSRIVRPDYPPGAAARGETGIVEIRGKIRPDGYLDDIELLPNTPASSIFADALKDLVREWRFVPATGNDCQPILTRVKATISFEIDNGTPRIFVTHQPLERSSAVRPDAPQHFRPLKRVQPQYPMWALNRGIVADVYARVVVDRSGKVTEVTSRAYSPQRGVRENGLKVFATEAEEALSQWKFREVPEGERAPWIGCWTIQFRIRDSGAWD